MVSPYLIPIQQLPSFTDFLSGDDSIYVAELRPIYPPYLNISAVVLLVLGILIYALITVVQGCSFVCICNYHLTHSCLHMSERTRRLQKSFFAALCIQEAIPVVSMAIPWTYYSILMFLQKDYINPAVNNFFFSILTTHGSVSCVSLIFLTDPYKKFVFGLLKRLPFLRSISYIQRYGNVRRIAVSNTNTSMFTE
ncbi:unnamed protein product, partial [Mesorhabditis belari]|uniref:G protein-coupled receptor n=1 Tax=Mesorhabditis belari TaxID=2138241 RepID=A0AAF3JAP4_9BILA